MKESRIVRTSVVILFAAALAGSISYQNYETKMQVGRIMTAAGELGKLVNLHYQVTTTDESASEGRQGISTEVWADLDSGKWAAVYASLEGEEEKVYQSLLYDGELSYGLNDTVEDWTELAEPMEQIPYYDALHTFYYSEEDFSKVSVRKESDTAVIEAVLSEDALEKVQEDAVESANQTYLGYVENNDTARMEAASLLLECAKQTKIERVEVSYTINRDGLLCGSRFVEYYSRPAILASEEGTVLGEPEAHVTTTTRTVEGYNDKDTTTSLHEYLNQVNQ